MKSAVVFCVLFFVALAVARPGEEQYTDRYDNINIQEILTNGPLLKSYVECILDKGRCTAEAKELKAHIKEALENECAKCTEAQKKGTREVIGHLINHEEGYWNDLTAKYDPEHKYSVKYEKELREVKA